MKSLLTPKRVIQTVLLVIVFIAVVYAVRQNPTAREVVGEAFAGLFGFFTTPFILEASVALLGLITVVTYNQWRINRDGDGWVTLEETDPQSAKSTNTSESQTPTDGTP
jgi:hypothetical protein